jgi:hypothetical protein
MIRVAKVCQDLKNFAGGFGFICGISSNVVEKCVKEKESWKCGHLYLRF